MINPSLLECNSEKFPLKVKFQKSNKIENDQEKYKKKETQK